MSISPENNKQYRTNELGETELRCPKCGSWATADFTDNGIGIQQCGPYHCDVCQWVEQQDWIGSFDADQSRK